MAKQVGIYIYPLAEVLDFSGPFEVFTTASRICPDSEPFAVSLISESDEVVAARSGYRVLSDCTISDHPELDVLLVVGGVQSAEMDKPSVINWIAAQAQRVSLVASVCTGVFLLAQAGVCQGKRVTTHWEDIPDLRRLFPGLEVVEDCRWVDEGALITSAGISAGIDMSLHLVERLHSRALAEKTARQMDFDWSS
ncbi:DJ-1/PfpI family protein [Litorivivens sp.]|uniref:DJ-1/PfpI family protein n=2 Tax=Litorivivens sp. TaxID=2020868 RepID=UPI003564F984